MWEIPFRGHGHPEMTQLEMWNRITFKSVSLGTYLMSLFKETESLSLAPYEQIWQGI